MQEEAVRAACMKSSLPLLAETRPSRLGDPSGDYLVAASCNSGLETARWGLHKIVALLMVDRLVPPGKRLEPK